MGEGPWAAGSTIPENFPPRDQLVLLKNARNVESGQKYRLSLENTMTLCPSGTCRSHSSSYEDGDMSEVNDDTAEAQGLQISILHTPL